jgi:hypothetical protein
MSKKSLRERWVEALTSGDYEQGEGALRRGRRFCCLGVALDLLEPDQWYVSDGSGDETGNWANRSNTGYPEDDQLEPFGISRQEGRFLAEYNDQGYTFAQIAKIINGEGTKIVRPSELPGEFFAEQEEAAELEDA